MKSNLNPLAKALAIIVPITVSACGSDGGSSAGYSSASSSSNADYNKLSVSNSVDSKATGAINTTVTNVVDGKNQSNFNNTLISSSKSSTSTTSETVTKSRVTNVSGPVTIDTNTTTQASSTKRDSQSSQTSQQAKVETNASTKTTSTKTTSTNNGTNTNSGTNSQTASNPSTTTTLKPSNTTATNTKDSTEQEFSATSSTSNSKQGRYPGSTRKNVTIPVSDTSKQVVSTDKSSKSTSEALPPSSKDDNATYKQAQVVSIETSRAKVRSSNSSLVLGGEKQSYSYNPSNQSLSTSLDNKIFTSSPNAYQVLVTSKQISTQNYINESNKTFKDLNSNPILPFTDKTPKVFSESNNRNQALFTNYLAVVDDRIIDYNDTASSEQSSSQHKTFTGQGVNIGLIDGRLNPNYRGFTKAPIRLDYSEYNANAEIVQSNKKATHGTEVGLVIAGKQEGDVLGLAPNSQLYYIEVPIENNLTSIYQAMLNNNKGIAVVNNSYNLANLENNLSYKTLKDLFINTANSKEDTPLFVYSSGNQATLTRADGSVIIDKASLRNSPSGFIQDISEETNNVVVVTGAKISVPSDQLKRHQSELDTWNKLSDEAKKITPKPVIIANWRMINKTETAVPCGVTKWNCLTGINYYSFPKDLVANGIDAGTSFATPQVTAGAALLKEEFPWMNASNLKTTLLTTASDVGEAGVDDTFGWGLLNFTRALRGPMQFAFGDFVADLKNHEGYFVWSNNVYGRYGLVLKGNLSDYKQKLILTGDNHYYGDTVVDSGTLVVTNKVNSHNHGSIYINHAGKLAAPNATLSTNNTRNNGILVAHNTRIEGDFEQTEYGLLFATPDNGLTVTGTAKLNGVLMLNNPSDYVSDKQKLRTIVKAGKISPNTKFTTKVENNFVNYDVYYDYTNNQVLVNIYRKSAQEVAKAVANNTDNSITSSASVIEKALTIADKITEKLEPTRNVKNKLDLQNLPTGELFANEYDKDGNIITVTNQGSMVSGSDELDIISKLINSQAIRPGTNSHSKDNVAVIADKYLRDGVYTGSGINPLWVNKRSKKWQAVELQSTDLNEDEIVDARVQLDYKDFETNADLDVKDLSTQDKSQLIEDSIVAQQSNAQNQADEVELSADNLGTKNITSATAQATGSLRAQDNLESTANSTTSETEDSKVVWTQRSLMDVISLTEDEKAALEVGKIIQNMNLEELRKLYVNVSPSSYANALNSQTKVELDASSNIRHALLEDKSTSYNWQAFLQTKYGAYDWHKGTASTLATQQTSSQTIAGLYRDIEQYRVGVFYGYNQNTWKQGYIDPKDNTFSAKGHQVGLSLVYKPQTHFNLGVSVSYSYFTNKVSRSIFSSGDITSEFTTNNVNTTLFASKEWQVSDRLSISAMAALSNYWTRLGAFSENTNETTKLFGLNYTKQDYHQQFANLGLSAKYSFVALHKAQSLALELDYTSKLGNKPIEIKTITDQLAKSYYDNRHQFNARLSHKVDLTKQLSLETSATYSKSANWNNKNIQVGLNLRF